MLGRRLYLGHLVTVACMAAVGCGDAQREQQLQVARESVVAGLEAWKRGETAQSLATGTTPIEFHDDDWQKSARLDAYEVISLYRETDNTPRCSVLLKIQTKGGKPQEHKVTYQVLTEPNVVIARDPFS